MMQYPVFWLKELGFNPGCTSKWTVVLQSHGIRKGWGDHDCRSGKLERVANQQAAIENQKVIELANSPHFAVLLNSQRVYNFMTF